MSTVTIGAVGDIAFHEGIAGQMRAHGAGWPFERVRPVLDRAQVLFGNFEFPFLPPDFPRGEVDPAAALSVVGGPEGARALKDAGFTILNLAANHLLDAGSVGLDHTRACLAEAGLLIGGVGYSQEEARRMVTVEAGGLRIGFLCYCEDGNWTLGATRPGPAYYELGPVLEDVAAHRDGVDVLVVSIHADIEFLPTPAPERMANFRRIARAGADVVLGHHPHVPQGIEMVDGSLVAYSLGNFVFGAHSMDYMAKNGPHTADSLVLLVEVGEGGVQGYERVPCTIPGPPEERPVVAEGTARESLLKRYAQLDAWLQDEDFVRETWRRRCKELLWQFITQAAERDVESVLDEVVGRAVLVAENRRWMEEVLLMARERWEKVSAGPHRYQRPNYWFQRP